jgi:hypothetical protein
MTKVILITFFALVTIATIIVGRFDRRRERSWRQNLLRDRPELSEDDIIRLFPNVARATALRALQFLADKLHVRIGRLRPGDPIVSFKAPYRSIGDDVWALDDALLGVYLADKEAASSVKTVEDIVNLIVNAQAKKGVKLL